MRKVSAGRAFQRVPELLTVAEWMCTVTALCVTALRALPRRVLLMQAKRASLSPPSSEILGLTGMPPSMLRNVGLRAAAAASAASAPSSSQCHAHQAPQRRKPKSNVDGGKRAEGSYAYTGGHEVSPRPGSGMAHEQFFFMYGQGALLVHVVPPSQSALSRAEHGVAGRRYGRWQHRL